MKAKFSLCNNSIKIVLGSRLLEDVVKSSGSFRDKHRQSTTVCLKSRVEGQMRGKLRQGGGLSECHFSAI